MGERGSSAPTVRSERPNDNADRSAKRRAPAAKPREEEAQVNYREESADDFGGQDQSGADGFGLDSGPQFDPERGVVYPEASGALESQEPIVETRVAGSYSPAPLELDSQAASHAFSSARMRTDGVPAEDPNLPISATYGTVQRARGSSPQSAPPPPNKAIGWGIALLVLLAVGAGIGGVVYFKQMVREARHAPFGVKASPQPMSGGDKSISQQLSDIAEKGRELQEKAKAQYEATKRGIEDLTNAHAPILIIESEPSGAEILIDGKWVGNTPYAGDNRLDKGAHDVVLRLDGFHDAPLQIQGGESSRLSVTLRRK